MSICGCLGFNTQTPEITKAQALQQSTMQPVWSDGRVVVLSGKTKLGVTRSTQKASAEVKDPYTGM